MSLSPETLALFSELLDRVSISAADPEFEAQCARVSLARRELAAAIDEIDTDNSN